MFSILYLDSFFSTISPILTYKTYVGRLAGTQYGVRVYETRNVPAADMFNTRLTPIIPSQKADQSKAFNTVNR